MKHFMTLMALAFAFTAGAQGTTIHEYPWNPDFNNDTYIGSEDLMGLLSTYGTQFGLPPEPCTYDGTPLEELSIAVFNGEILIDSIFIEYQLENTITYFIPGCPEMVTDTITISNYGMTYNPGSFSSTQFPTTIFATGGEDAFDSHLDLALLFNQSTNRYVWYLSSNAIYDQYGDEDVFGSFHASTNTSGELLPWPNDWSLTEDGISIDWQNGWTSYANYLHILPYWHYAE